MANPGGEDGDQPGRPDPSAGFPKLAPASKLLFSLRARQSARSTAVRSGLAFGLPAAIALLLGHPDSMFLVLSGSYAILFGTGAYRTRVRAVAAVAAVLVLSAAGGAGLGWAVRGLDSAASPGDWSWWVPVVVLSLFATLSCFTITAIRLRAGAATFPVMVAGGSMLAFHSGFSVLEVAGWGLLGGVSAIAFSSVGWLFHPSEPERVAVGTALRAVDDYRAAIESGSPTLHPRNRAADACHEA